MCRGPWDEVVRGRWDGREGRLCDPGVRSVIEVVSEVPVQSGQTAEVGRFGGTTGASSEVRRLGLCPTQQRVSGPTSRRHLLGSVGKGTLDEGAIRRGELVPDLSTLYLCTTL